jgi:hypothetical protein
MDNEKLDKLIDAIILLRDALMYHAGVIGYKADSFNVGPDGKPHTELKLTTPPDNEITEFEVMTIEPEKAFTFDEIRSALNAMAKKHGKEKALELVKKYNTDGDIKAIAIEQYASLMSEVL